MAMESCTRWESGTTDQAFPDRSVAKGLSARHLTARTDAFRNESGPSNCGACHTPASSGQTVPCCDYSASLAQGDHCIGAGREDQVADRAWVAAAGDSGR
ncbi:hypothetical protein GCM10009630_06210 [Kribbella jejuensis]